MGQNYEQILSKIAVVEKTYEDFLNSLKQQDPKLYNDFDGLNIQKALVYNLMMMCGQGDESDDTLLEFFGYYTEHYEPAKEIFTAVTSNNIKMQDLMLRYKHKFSIGHKTHTRVSFWLKLQVYSMLYTSKDVFKEIVRPYVEIIVSAFEGYSNYEQNEYIGDLLESYSNFMKTFENKTLEEQQDIINYITNENIETIIPGPINNKKDITSHDTVVTVENDFKITIPKGYVYSLDKSIIEQHRSIVVLLNDHTADFEDVFSATESISMTSPLKFSDLHEDLFNDNRDFTNPEIINIIEMLKAEVYDAQFDPSLSWMFSESSKSSQANRLIHFKRNREMDISYFMKSRQDDETIFMSFIFTKKRLYQVQFYYNGTNSLEDYKGKVISLLNSITI